MLFFSPFLFLFIGHHLYAYAHVCYYYADQCVNMTTNTVAMLLTAVLCTVISAVIGSVVTALVTCYCIMRRKKKEGSKDDKHNPLKAEPVYDTPQVLGESGADIELKENTCYASKTDAH